ncbi:hypothetical protein K474DRAFT_1707115 [Panus rudis PR-1116 ss-1]|nr:hypothetical protein K474DRAFT_1707115 [Panus rudis PR-1116 ss-1]
MTLRVATGQLLGTLLELLAYGAYSVLLPQGVIILKRKGIKGSVSIYLLCTLLLSFVATTVHAVVDIVRLMQAFGSSSTDPNYPDLYFADLNSPLDLTKNSCYIIVTILADALIVFRTFIIWGRSYRIIVLPILLLLADMGTAFWFNWSLTANKIEDQVVHSPTWQITKYFCAVTLALNFLCTFLIAWKIWRTQRITNTYLTPGNHQLGGALIIILESAAIYSALLFAVLGLALAGNGAVFVILNLMPPVIGVIFFYVILRSSKGSSQFFSTTQQNTGNASGGFSHISARRKTSRFTGNGDSIAVVPEDGVHIHLEQVVQSDFDAESQKQHGLQYEHGDLDRVASDV